VESDEFPEEFFKVKVLPELLKSVEFGGGGPKSFALVMRIADKLAEDEYDTQITPVVVRLFTSPDRALRVCLLDNLPLMIDHLSQKIVSDKIFPQMVTGFGDLAPVVREQTVKAVLVVVPKLSDRIINGELLRHLAKTANDEQPGIRTNTTICLGKIAKNLGVSSRAKVLTAAFSRALRDPFVHARNAALMALAATADVFSEDDCATKMLPAICPSLVDKEKMIRDQANKTLAVYLDRVRKYATTLPDTVLPPPETVSAGGTRMSTPQPGNQSANAQGGSQWMGWAISSFTNKLGTATGEIQPNGTVAAAAVAAVSSRPNVDRTSSSSAANGRPSSDPRVVLSSARPAQTHTSSLRTGTSTPTADEEDFGGGWGDMEDMNDDAAPDDDEVVDAWGEDVVPKKPVVSRSTTAASKVSSSSNYDDGGEPDFEGWLNAKAKAKTGTGPLPKGLAKKTTTTTAIPAARTAANAAATRTAVKSSAAATPAKVTPISKTKPTPKSKDEEEDGWGDAWD
jgi:SCY1-like protein 1